MILTSCLAMASSHRRSAFLAFCLVSILTLLVLPTVVLAQGDATTADSTPGTVLTGEGIPLPHASIGSVVRGLTALGAFRLIAYAMGLGLISYGIRFFMMRRGR